MSKISEKVSAMSPEEQKAHGDKLRANFHKNSGNSSTRGPVVIHNAKAKKAAAKIAKKQPKLGNVNADKVVEGYMKRKTGF